jgi:hypothetical protein
MRPEIKDDRQLRALTGVPKEKWDILENAFGRALKEEKERVYQEQVAQGKRKRKAGGGQKGKLPTVYEKLLFLLYYLKVYPTFDVLGTQFGMNRSKACENIHSLFPVLCNALSNLGVLPYREFKTVEEFRTACQGIEKILIDATERPHSRPVDNEEQKELYSGKKTSYDKEYNHFNRM